MGDAPRRSWAGGPRGTHGSPRGVVDRDGHAGGGLPHGDAGGGAARRKGGRWGGGARPSPQQQRAAVTRGRWRLGGDGGAGGGEPPWPKTLARRAGGGRGHSRQKKKKQRIPAWSGRAPSPVLKAGGVVPHAADPLATHRVHAFVYPMGGGGSTRRRLPVFFWRERGRDPGGTDSCVPAHGELKRNGQNRHGIAPGVVEVPHHRGLDCGWQEGWRRQHGGRWRGGRHDGGRQNDGRRDGRRRDGGWWRGGSQDDGRQHRWCRSPRRHGPPCAS